MPDKHKHTLFLREGDWDYITEVYGPRQIPTSKVVRSIVSQFVDRLRESEGETKLPDKVDVKL